MNIKSILIEKLTHLVNEFTSIKCQYKYDESFETHYVKITPAIIFKNSSALKKAKFAIVKEFYKMFPTESIMFSTDDSLMEIEYNDVVIIGKDFRTKKTSTWINTENANTGLPKYFGSMLSAGENNYALAA